MPEGRLEKTRRAYPDGVPAFERAPMRCDHDWLRSPMLSAFICRRCPMRRDMVWVDDGPGRFVEKLQRR